MKDNSNKFEEMLEKEKNTVYNSYKVDNGVKMRLDRAFDATYGSKSEVKKSAFYLPFLSVIAQYFNQLFGVKAGLSIASVVLIASLYFQVNTSVSDHNMPATLVADSAQVSDTANATPLDSVHAPM